MVKYVVVSVYYKHGEYCVAQFESTREVRAFLEDEVTGFQEQTGDADDLRPPHRLPFKELVDLALESGRNYIAGQHGYGVVSVIRGTVLE